jgi:transcriptional regulator with XRE-family HTH domain
MNLRTAQEAAQLLITSGKSQQVIAERAGVKQPTISRILSGELKDPAGSILVKLNEFADEVAAKASAA